MHSFTFDSTKEITQVHFSLSAYFDRKESTADDRERYLILSFCVGCLIIGCSHYFQKRIMSSSGPPLTVKWEIYKVTGYLATGHYVIGLNWKGYVLAYLDRLPNSKFVTEYTRIQVRWFWKVKWEHSNVLCSTPYHSSTSQHSTSQYSTSQHSTSQHSTVQHIKAHHSTAQHSTAQIRQRTNDEATHTSSISSEPRASSEHIIIDDKYGMYVISFSESLGDYRWWDGLWGNVKGWWYGLVRKGEMKESALNSHGTQCIQCSVMLWREGHFKLGEREKIAKV